MSIGTESPSGEIPDSYSSLLAKQQMEYQYVRNKASNIMGIVLAVISIVISFGFIRFLLTGGAIQRASLELSDTIANRCSPEALTHSNVSLVGLGPTISITAIGILLLSFYLVIEMWISNQLIQSFPTSLYPRHEADFWTSNYQEWIGYNDSLISECEELLVGIQRKLYYSLTLAVVGMVLIALVYFDHGISVLLLGLVLIGSGVFYAATYIEQHYLTKLFSGSGLRSSIMSKATSLTVVIIILITLVVLVFATHVLLLPYLGLTLVLGSLLYLIYLSKTDRVINRMKDRVFHLRTRNTSPLFLSLSIIILSYLIGKYIWIFLLIDHFLLC